MSGECSTPGLQDLPEDENCNELPPSKKRNEEKQDVIYGIEETPVWYLSILLGLQHYITMVGTVITIPFILTPLLCMAEDDPSRAIFITTIIFVSGIATLAQTTFGSRLPIVEGGSFGFLVPVIAIITTSYPSCDQYNFSNMTSEERSEVWHVRIREIQGDIMVASLLQVLVGFTGLIGYLLTWITPLTIVPVISMTGLSLIKTAALKSEGNWPISFLTIALFVAFSLYMADVEIPIPSYKKSKGCRTSPFKLFNLFPVLLALVIPWIVCVVLTITNVLPPGNSARTDLRSSVISKAPWFYVPYPFQWGMPTITAAGIIGTCAGVLATMIESVGDYYATARLAGGPPPPKHSINRGIGVEGLGCVLAGMFGTGTGVVTYAENIGTIRASKVGSRSVVQVAAVMMLISGVFGKFGGLFVTLPDPVVGGFFIVMFSIITAVGLSNLQFVNLNSSRNLFILGFSIFFGLTFPNWLQANERVINTGITEFDQVITVLLSTPMFVGGFFGCILDNSVPGTDEERGLDKWNNMLQSRAKLEDGQTKCTVYDLPFKLEGLFSRWSCCTKVPFSPTYTSSKKSSSNSIKEKIIHVVKKMSTSKSSSANISQP